MRFITAVPSAPATRTGPRDMFLLILRSIILRMLLQLLLQLFKRFAFREIEQSISGHSRQHHQAPPHRLSHDMVRTLFQHVQFIKVMRVPNEDKSLSTFVLYPKRSQ